MSSQTAVNAHGAFFKIKMASNKVCESSTVQGVVTTCCINYLQCRIASSSVISKITYEKRWGK